MNQKSPLEILQELGGYYKCPKNTEGKRLGPLVGYAGTYVSSGLKKQYVGDVYANFAKADEHPYVMNGFAKSLIGIMGSKVAQNITVVCGPQMGGVAIGQMVALELTCRFACIEKVVTQLATDTLREQSYLDFLRHSIRPGDRVLITEDVANNFSTTKQCIALIEQHGGTVVGIATLLNRSEGQLDEYVYDEDPIPVYSLVKMKIDQWRQEDPEVADDIAAKNVVLKPKNEWLTLEASMNSHR